ncbi:response regulator [Pelagicoccus sp. NFK12]|uniref:Sensory/regulatory protein RpfC n=1 Tax=Pelagicoccus enzymogenes TaxID=2773457 RepID=A0A927F7J3_9BACT|nr:hybrid sensor histidine kinase/response regulator [Pelagicoccus enzymogenes]MBD5779903.1 response regulator [Pelagicoccus enzymogenes]
MLSRTTPKITTAFRPLIASLALCLAFACSCGGRNLDFAKLDDSWKLTDLRLETVNLFGNRSAGRIQTITQTNNGLIWVGSHQGLFRFDGRRIRTFFHDPRDPSSLPNESVTTLHVDAQGRLWIGTEQGAALFKPDTEEFIHYLQPADTGDIPIATQVNGIVHDSQGTIYAANEAGRIFRFDEDLGDFAEIGEHRLGAIKSLSIDSLDRLWIGSSDCVYVFNPQTYELQAFKDAVASKDRVTIDYVTSICAVDDNEVWLATTVKGVVVLNPSDGSYEEIPYDSQPEAYANEVRVGPKGRVWVANNAGLTLIDQASRKRISSPQDNKSEINSPPSGINTLFVDHQGTIWAGSNYDGVSKATSYKRFETLALHERNTDVRPFAPALAFLEDKEGNLWVGHPKSGLAMYPKNGDDVLKVTHDPENPDSLTDQPILSLFEDSRGQIWIGTYRGGLYRYDPTTGELAGFHHDPDDPYSIGGHDVRAIVEDHEGTLWFATHGSGVVSFDPSTERFTNYTQSNRERTGFYVQNDWINTLLIDREGAIWLSARNGVVRIASDRSSYTHFLADVTDEGSLSNSRTTDLFEDSKGRIWIGTKDGLNRFLPETQSFKSYSLAEGLPDRSISSIIEDEQGYLWIGTLGGLARFDPVAERAKAFDTTDGLVSDDFFETGAYKAQGGILYFGQNQGLTRFDPSEIVDDTDIPNVFITGIRVSGEPLRVDEEGPLSKSLLNTSRVKLNHDQNALVFEFVAIDFKNPAKNEYRYKLERFDRDWTQASTRAEAVYTNIPPGNYVFRVQAANIDGYWNEQGDSLAIQITPPFWGTVWFRLLIVFLVIAIPVAIFFWRIKAIRNEAKRLEIAVAERTKDLKQANIWLAEANAKTQSHGELLEKTVRERTKELKIAKEKAEHSDRLKSAFLANMSHEIRTPMNAIIGFLHMLESSDLTPEERQHFHDIINQSSKSLMSLIDDILDLSAIEAGEAEIALQTCDLDEICEELGALFRESVLAQKKGKVSFKLERRLPDSFDSNAPLTVVTDPLRLKQILWNLLSNALKFTEEGEIRLGITIRESEPGGRLEIEYAVKDTGIGIPQEEHQRIFNRFHKLDEAGKKLYRGTGLGLTITHTLISLMDGKITLQSEPNVGTEFFVTFPFFSKLEDSQGGSTPSGREASFLHADFSHFNLLVVEDETPNFEYIKRVLKKTGINIRWVNRGGEAIEVFKNGSFDLVLLDLKLPEVDGYQVARQIREVSPAVPIIVQSAYAMREDIARSQKAGANEHLSKPFSPKDLISVLTKYLLTADSK